MSDPPPLSRLAGRASRRWWHRHGGTVRRVSQPARKGWAGLMGTLWILAYAWIGVLLAVGGRNLTGASGPWAFIAGVSGGIWLGMWQARHRMARHEDPSIGPLPRFGLALLVWLAVVAGGLVLDLS